MQLNDSLILTIQGIAEAAVFKKLSKKINLSENQRWVFTDYAVTMIPLGTKFNVILEGDAKSLVPGIYVIKVLECLNQFGTNFSEIPAGWKTICKLDFYPEVPTKIDTLPEMSGWEFNPNRITLASLAAM